MKPLMERKRSIVVWECLTSYTSKDVRINILISRASICYGLKLAFSINLSSVSYTICSNVTTLWATSADDNLILVFWFFPENRLWHFKQILSKDQSLFVWDRPEKKYVQNVVCWIFPACSEARLHSYNLNVRIAVPFCCKYGELYATIHCS